MADQPYRTSTFTHLWFLVGEALKPTSARRSTARPRPARPGLLDRLDQRLWRQRQKDREAFLARASDIADLERRLRDLERTPYY